MKACPLEFSHPSEAIQLNGLGPKLCDRLTEKLKEYCDQHGLPMPEPPNKKKTQKRQSGDDLTAQDQPAKKKKAKPYVPALRSGAYALILGLSTIDENSSQGMSKAQLIEVAQAHSDTSFTAPSDPTKFYTAWNSMKTLITKELVYEQGRPLRKYALTEEGWECAKRIRNTSAVGLPLPNQSVCTHRSGMILYFPDFCRPYLVNQAFQHRVAHFRPMTRLSRRWTTMVSRFSTRSAQYLPHEARNPNCRIRIVPQAP